MRDEQGLALLGVFLVILMMTVLGVASLTVTGLGNRMAGSTYENEAGLAAAESCVGTGVNIISQTIDQGEVPAGYYLGGGGALPVPSKAENIAIPPTLTQEIWGQADNDPDFPIGTGSSPDIQMWAGPFVIAGDIDRLYVKTKGALAFASGYDRASPTLGVEAYYQIDCTATRVATGSMSRVRAVYACVGTPGESCQRMGR